jgi:hypothetical protein
MARPPAPALHDRKRSPLALGAPRKIRNSVVRSQDLKAVADFVDESTKACSDHERTNNHAGKPGLSWGQCFPVLLPDIAHHVTTDVGGNELTAYLV